MNPKNIEKKALLVVLSKNMYDDLKQRSKETCINMSDLTRLALMQYFKNESGGEK